MSFSVDEIDRYARQVVLPEWGAAGQERVRAAHVTVAGTGVAAEIAARYLAGAGVGALAVSTPEQVALVAQLNPHVASSVSAGSLAAGACLSLAIGDWRVSYATDGVAAGAEAALAALRFILGVGLAVGLGVGGRSDGDGESVRSPST